MNGSTARKHPTNREQEMELVRWMLRGDEAAFRRFFDLYKDRLFASVFAYVGCRHDAEEIVQEAFFKALKHLPKFKHKSQLYTWIYRIAWNAAANRTRRTREEISLEASGADQHSSAPESFEPHVPIERREKVESLRRALADIDQAHRQILILREFDELSYREIAEAMEIPMGTVRSRLARARERLREQLVETEHRGGGDQPISPAARLSVIDQASRPCEI